MLKFLKVLLLIASINIACKADCQIIKTYSGPFDDGNAIYDYYETDNLDRIFNGRYIYTEKNLKIEGQFKGNIKVGMWKYTYVDKDFTSYNTIDSKKLIGFFKNGMMEGEWKYSFSRLLKNKGVQQSVTMIAYFNNNNFIGKFTVNDSNTYHSNSITKLNIRGVFSSQGMLDSTWLINYTQNKFKFETRFKFQDGILENSFSRNLSNGEIIERIDSSLFYNSFISGFDNSINLSFVYSKPFKKAIYELTLGEGNQEGPTFEDNNSIETKSINEVISKREIVPNYSFSFNSEIQSKTDAAEELSLALAFWIYIHNGDFFKITKGSNTTIIYPKAAIIEQLQ